MKTKLQRFVIAACALLFLLVSSFALEDASTSDVHGIAVYCMVLCVVPGVVFFSFGNGAWLKRTEIPPDRPSVGVFSRLADLTNERTRGLIEEIAKSSSGGDSSARQLADLYNSFMNEAAIESRGLAPLKAHLDSIRAIKDKHDLARVFGESLRADVDALNNTNFHTPNLFGMWVAPGFNDSDHYTAYLMQGGLELPDREYYVADNPRMQEIRTKYQGHVAAMLKLAGFDDVDTRAARILELEHSIAEKHITLEESYDIHKANNTWKQSDFATRAPGLDWQEYFRAAGLSKQKEFMVWQPTAFTGQSALVASVPLETWKDWLAYHLVEDNAAYLPKALADERFNFFGKTLSGTPEQRPRWQRGMVIVNEHLGDSLGKIYVQRYFPQEAKTQAQEMVENIRAAFHKRIDALAWMAAPTKAEAHAKLDALYVGIGYPDSWHEYSGYEVKADDIFGNVWRGNLFEYHRQIKRLGANVDRKEWCMLPQTVNAVNLPLQNGLNFPAAILQPPFFDPKAPAAVNYGAIGTVIGHEISHTFDSEGSAFDGKGRVRNWWQEADLAHFNAATSALAAQYDAYKPFPDLHVNGKQTLTEDIADVAGIAAAYDGFRASLAGKPAPEQDGFSGDQQFFIAFGQNWGTKTREATLRRQILTNEHAPSQYRAATVRNIDAWYSSFDVKPGEKLYLAPPDRVRIW